MTRDQIVAQIQRYLGFRRGLQDTIITELISAQIELELQPVKPWFIQSEYANIVFTIGDQRLPLPDDFILEVEEDGIQTRASTSTKWVSLEKEDIDQLEKSLGSDAVGLPEFYAISGNYLRVYPTPDDTYSARMLYYAKQPLLTSGDSTNSWTLNIPDLLVGDAGRRVAAQLRDKAAADTFAAMMASAVGLLRVANEARQHTNRSYQMGGPH